MHVVLQNYARFGFKLTLKVFARVKDIILYVFRENIGMFLLENLKYITVILSIVLTFVVVALVLGVCSK